MDTAEKEQKEFLKRLGQRIKKIRKLRHVKQVELAYQCDMEKQNMYRIEAGQTNPSIVVLWKIATNLQVELSELVRDI